MIIWRSPRHLSPYRIFLGNTALTQLLLAVVSVVIAPRILTEGFNIVNIYLGPSQLLGPWYSFMLYVTMCKFDEPYLMCLTEETLPYIGLTYSTNVTEADQITHHMVPNIEKYSTVVSANILQIPVLWNMFCCVVLLVPIYAIMYFSRWKILTMLEEAIIGHSQQTKLRIKLFVKALTVQSLVPILSVFPSAVSYSLIQSGVLKPQLFSYVIVPGIGIGPAIDPIITMYYVAPYRLFVSATLLSRSSIASETQHAPSNINNTRCAGRNNPRMSIAPS
ncbi:7TM chemoreceptor [Ancylostoma ceylanicum]|uniref:7TM chemoreceptor n=1 Tax=Ancylostoma ceylanicum TaxID=53326 RepID=A0A0D6LHJ3_9BILA|nr:7TM chemoreceptor [Ancylostoma ceylanicum]